MQFPTVNREHAEKVFIVVENNEGNEIPINTVCEFSQSTTAADQGRLVELVDAAVNLTTGLSAKVAGVSETTIATSEVGRLQVYGPATVRAQTTMGAGILVVASSINATNIGHVTTASTSTLTAPSYVDACIGWTLEESANATNATVFLSML